MTDIEIPDKSQRHGHYRFFEILPVVLSISVILLLFVLSLLNVTPCRVFRIVLPFHILIPIHWGRYPIAVWLLRNAAGIKP